MRGLFGAILVLASSAASAATVALSKAEVTKLEIEHYHIETNCIALNMRKAEAGDAKAQWLVARALLWGIGCEKDVDAGYKWAKKSAKQQFAPGVNLLGVCYEDGLGVESDCFTAVKLYEHAMKKGSFKGQNNLGRCYQKGIGVAKDNAKGLELRVAAAKVPGSTVYLDLGNEAGKVGECLIWYRLAMDAGLEIGKLEFMYCLGRDTSFIDYGEYHHHSAGFDSYCNGAGRYDYEWKIDNAFCYKFFSEGVKKAEYYKRELNVSDYFIGYLNFMMGRCTEKGWACKEDPVVALRWYYRAQALGYKEYANCVTQLEQKFSPETVKVIKKKEGLLAQKRDAAAIEKMASEAAQKTFAFKGFYLGMQIADAKVMVEKYLPESKVVIASDNTIEIDVTHSDEFDVTPMVFCKANDKGEVMLFNFDKRFLDQWFKYDVQTYAEWAGAYGREFGCDFRRASVDGKRDLGNVWISVSQEVFQYRNNAKKCIVSYFGEKEVTDPNSEVTINDFVTNPVEAGRIAGVRSWVKNGWENGDGAREGTLRVARIN